MGNTWDTTDPRELPTMAGIMGRRMLSKAEEEGGDEVEVRREDQDKINRFSRLHQRELALQEELAGKSKEKAQEMLEAATSRTDEETNELEEKLGSVRDEMKQLKVDLYARFGKQINLET